ncbi:3-dehydroshikimate dehydratase [Aspergillus sclerotialis]|uniref:3-dehydroshikimate dehydratase n=1 Tax=Aspergillus sclerotialis TaxID=2070753 RepID=A0A3A2ZX01_9EURO|nr:3-dehydroshikimate dehydratase [Aspergillus sclerotialis]
MSSHLLPAIPNMSLGAPGVHSLPSKLHQASIHGFQGIELFIEDLNSLAETSFSGNHLAAAHHVRNLCDKLNLTIICLQPFLFYEGLLDRTQHDHLLNTKLTHWFKISRILGTDLIQVPSNFLPADPETGELKTSGDMDLIISDLQKIADIGAAQDPPFRFVYEAISWGNHVYNWEDSYRIVEEVNRPNFGLCLDTFHILARVYADPLSPTFITSTAKQDLQACLASLRRIDPRRIYYIQVVDGERLNSALDETHPFYVKGRPCRMSWSRNARLFPFEEERGAFMPVLEVVKAILDAGFEGWVSLELFHRDLARKDDTVPAEYAARGIESLRELGRRLSDLNVRSAAETGVVQHRL